MVHPTDVYPFFQCKPPPREPGAFDTENIVEDFQSHLDAPCPCPQDFTRVLHYYSRVTIKFERKQIGDYLAWAPIQRYILSGHANSGYWFDALGWVSYYFAQLEWGSYDVVDHLGDANEKSRV